MRSGARLRLWFVSLYFFLSSNSQQTPFLSVVVLLLLLVFVCTTRSTQTVLLDDEVNELRTHAENKTTLSSTQRWYACLLSVYLIIKYPLL